MVVRNVIFPRVLVYEGEAGRGWTTSGGSWQHVPS